MIQSTKRKGKREWEEKKEDNYVPQQKIIPIGACMYTMSIHVQQMYNSTQ